MISLFYRGWEKYRFYIGYEADEQDTLTPRVHGSSWPWDGGAANRSYLPDRVYLTYAGLLGRHVRSAAMR